MSSGVPVVELVTFRVNDSFTPERFKEVRDWVDRGRAYGLNAQYWGQAVEKTRTLHWLLLWDSREAHGTLQADPGYPALVAKVDAMANGPVRVLHVHFATHPPTALLEAPVTEIDIYRVTPGVMPQYQRWSEELCAYITKLGIPGFVACTYGPALEEGGDVGVYMGAWNAVEDHNKLGDGDEEFQKLVSPMLEVVLDLRIAHVSLQRHS
ncbi:hypothetical protein BV25DRAFT_1828624 [Artomyces pyxidatus]|uniref:Uncharacterized protein n=1 Tax=Artomyces pyxidatus TaxID=48021 RepID=A0ACB8SUM6_9AGAM|nr:hypothetical protein BV25DRAFT_1828624 [Artomyces pyxidatus]